MPHNQQAVAQTKRDCRYDEQIHRGDAVRMIAEERPPALGWRVSSLGHVRGHAGLSDIDAELEEFSMDPRRSPQRIGNAHLADKLAYLHRHCRPATPALSIYIANINGSRRDVSWEQFAAERLSAAATS